MSYRASVLARVHCGRISLHYIATMLHPNLKSFDYTPQQRYHAETLLQLEFEKYQESHSQSPSPDELSDGVEATTEIDRYPEDKTKIP
ncbi:hypothetical protein I4U23_016651 [Adineta vaga]|nr:hypothetical protein I4U23_016651 [Adineta vaga]